MIFYFVRELATRCSEGSMPVMGVRRYRTDEEKRRMVERTLASGEPVAVMARHNGVNANRLFYWRKQY
jgi:transposase-like protein